MLRSFAQVRPRRRLVVVQVGCSGAEGSRYCGTAIYAGSVTISGTSPRRGIATNGGMDVNSSLWSLDLMRERSGLLGDSWHGPLF